MNIVQLSVVAWFTWTVWLLVQRQPHAAVGCLYGGAIGALLSVVGIGLLFLSTILFAWLGPGATESRSSLVTTTFGLPSGFWEGLLSLGCLVGAALGRKIGRRTDWKIVDESNGILSVHRRRTLIVLFAFGLALAAGVMSKLPGLRRSEGEVAQQHITEGRHAKAEAFYRKKLEAAEKSQDPYRLVKALYSLEGVVRAQGRQDEADELDRRVLAIISTWGDDMFINLNSLANLYAPEDPEAISLRQRAQAFR